MDGEDAGETSPAAKGAEERPLGGQARKGCVMPCTDETVLLVVVCLGTNMQLWRKQGSACVDCETENPHIDVQRMIRRCRSRVGIQDFQNSESLNCCDFSQLVTP